MARDDSGASDLEGKLAQVQAELAATRAENEALRSITRVLIEEISPEAFGRARERLGKIDAGEEPPDARPGG